MAVVTKRTIEHTRNDMFALGVRLVAKNESRLMRALGVFLGSSFIDEWWTTFRLPFAKHVCVYHPPDADPVGHWRIVDHELVHAADLRHWYGPWLFMLGAALLPLPVLFSGRWFIERHAYLRDIQQGRCSIEQAVDVLWWRYGFCWPRPLMRRWFVRHV